MRGGSSTITGALRNVAAYAAGALALVSCGGGGSTGSERNSGINKTYLSVEASDADGDALHYQWRVTSGSIENRDSRETVWTLPEGPGLHFAYVTISDGKGGWTEQQYAVASDPLNELTPPRPAVDHVAPAVVDIDGTQSRLRFSAASATLFAPPQGGTALPRIVYLPDVQVQIVLQSTGSVVFAGRTNARGELDLPKLQAGSVYDVRCATADDAPLVTCDTFTQGPDAGVRIVLPAQGPSRNLRLHGHVALADGTVCGTENAFFNIHTAATVQLQQADGSALAQPVRVNRFGDYALDAAVPVRAALRLRIQCEGAIAVVDVPASSDPAGYVATSPIELSHALANSRPRIVKMVANGADGNVRGQMVEPEEGAASNAIVGADHFLTFKGRDTKLSGCMYYRALGAVRDCDAQGNMIEPISFADWKRKNGFGTPSVVTADYINQRDLNLVRRMVATRSSSGGIAFYVCNHPGPEGKTQKEIDDVIETGLKGERRVACVAMEYTPTTGANGGLPFTKFFTFLPSGELVSSVNLDGRGEKYMPGTCVACHGGTTYNGRFPERPGASPNLGARFLPFDTGNYLFSSRPELGEAAQSEAFYQLNQLVAATEPAPDTPTHRLINGWYANGRQIDKNYVPAPWLAADANPATPGAARFYREVVGTSCRTCHVALGSRFDWDSIILSPARARTQVCGGTPDLAVNASMPNALASGDRLLERARDNADVAALMTQFLGCSSPSPDPVYAKR
jgi:mono/diheme cytochrome c family protein